jgi:hypothetical protein
MPDDTVGDDGATSQYIASRYDGLATGPDLTYTFENQRGVPYDGTNKLARRLSPFTFRLVIPEFLVESLGSYAPDVNLLGRAVQSTDDKSAQANEIRAAIGIPQITGSTSVESVLNGLRSTLSAGQALQTTLGDTERAVLTDLVTVADIQYQVEKMLQVPPLTLFVNPNSLSISHSTVQQYTNRTRYGYVFERWGEGQVTLSISGSTGAFCAGNPSGTAFGPTTLGSHENEVPSGVQYASKRDSAAYQQLVSLFQLYKNNGYIYDTVGKSEAHLAVGAVAIDYDQMTYIGNIDSFEYSYTEEMQHRIEWSMEFTVGRMYDHAEEPVVVAPQSTPNPGVGGLSDAELLRLVADTPTQNSIGNGNPSFINVSGTEQFQADESRGETPLSVVGSYFSPTSLLG